MQFFTRKTKGCNILFNSANKQIFSALSATVICWQEIMVTIKKKEALPPFVSVNALLFSMRAPIRNYSISWKIIDSPHESRPHNKILFPRYIISQSSGGPQLCQLINQRSKTNIYIPAGTARTGFDNR